ERSWIDQDGNSQFLTFGENGDFEAEYSIGLDYSSGFDLRENNILDLIWYGKNKEQFFSWYLEGNHIIIDDGTLEFTVLSVNETTLELEFNEGNSTYSMVKLKE
ncbi:hypothetical protein, partial [Xanthovirga aplysinae]|uniref:hypothetical protein n=1 Tax=Xanthovirga aplysinae TaxID=2529853 RepID=UPI001656A102